MTIVIVINEQVIKLAENQETGVNSWLSVLTHSHLTRRRRIITNKNKYYDNKQIAINLSHQTAMYNQVTVFVAVSVTNIMIITLLIPSIPG